MFGNEANTSTWWHLGVSIQSQSTMAALAETQEYCLQLI